MAERWRKTVLIAAIAEEQRAREAAQVIKPSMFKLLADRQIALFCFIYFSIALTIYGATFWLPSMIKKMGNLGDFQVGLLNSIPWIISIIAMYGFAALAGKWKFQQAWVAVTLVVAAFGMFMSTTGGPIFAFVAICFAAIGFKAASALFWPIPQGYLDARIAAAVIALINSIGNLGGFVAPDGLRFPGADHRFHRGRPVWVGRHFAGRRRGDLFRPHRTEARYPELTVRPA